MSKKATYKVVDIFGQEHVLFVQKKAKRVSLFDKYDDFVEKFEEKKTTDDCYTPKPVFDVILEHVREKCNIDGLQIIRPFYPGGDFESIEYPENCVVIDNPPFSIISKIARFYIEKNVRFFLFAPHMTLFSSDIDCTHIVVGAGITYENGAVVKTSFLSNLFGDYKVIGDAELLNKLKELEKQKAANLPKYEYPENVLMVSDVQWIIERGISFSVSKTDTKHCRQLDAQRIHKKGLFGSGFLISERAAAERAAAERAAAERVFDNNSIVWELSKREIEIIKSLGNSKP